MFGRQPMYPGMSKKPSMMLPLLYLIFSLYFILPFFKVFPIPANVLEFNHWITLVGGILLLISSITSFFRASRGY